MRILFCIVVIMEWMCVSVFAAGQRWVPPLCHEMDWRAAGLSNRALALPYADLKVRDTARNGKFVLEGLPHGGTRSLNPGAVLVKFKNEALVAAVKVESGREVEAARVIGGRSDVEFAEPDVIQQRAALINDPLIGSQWHHSVIHSQTAWDYGFGQSEVRVAVVDAPFQMDHPDLVANTVDGWDVVSNQVVHSSAGISHSTLCAGLISAVVNNGIGVAGVANCRILPINITGATSEMCDAVYWAADNNVRVVNISWTGADSSALNAAGAYLRTHSRGLLVMAGGNGVGELDYDNQPDIWCVSMTDAADNPHSKYGRSIDFAAPGFAMFSTTTNSSYATDSGTSYAAPVFAGVVARLFAINPLLEPDDAIDILKQTAVDLGDSGWDMWFGWGRIDFGAAAAMAWARLPRINISSVSDGVMTIQTGVDSSFECQLWTTKFTGCGFWSLVSNAIIITNDGKLYFECPITDDDQVFYRLSIGEKNH